MTDEIPRWLAAARELTGVREAPGSADNPVILAWLDEIASAYPEMASYCSLYRHDSTPWCGVLAAICMVRAGVRPPFGPIDTKRFMWANAWASDGWPATRITPKPGAVMVFTRDGGGHVAFYEDETAENYIVRGGNQSDSVSTIVMPKRQFTAAVWPSEPKVQPVLPSSSPSSDAKPLFRVRGKMSTFGGPADTGMSRTEGLSLFNTAEEMRAHGLGDYILSESEAGASGLGRRLNPEKFYVACRWWDHGLRRAFVQDAKVVIENPANGRREIARAVDFGPASWTGRVADLSPGLARALDLATDDICEVTIYADQQKEPPMSAEPLPANPPPLKLPPAAPYADALAELVAQKLQEKLAQPETKASMAAVLSTLFGGMVTQSPVLGVGLLLAQQLLASGGLVGTMAGATATTTGQNVGSTGVAVIAAGMLNWLRQALTRKPGTPS